MNLKDGGPAFPVTADVLTDFSISTGNRRMTGMSLRDWFAGQAAAGISEHDAGPKAREGETVAQAHARWSYQIADAMLAERAK